MPFIPINPDNLAKNLAHITVNVKLIGEPAVQFKKMMEDNKISGKALAAQMVSYCLAEAVTPPAKK